jgi:cytoskeletal protein CcmA (bactofilin family)
LKPDEPPPRRPLAEPRTRTTVIGPGTVFRGDLAARDPVQIQGTLEGDCRSDGRCTVAAGGRVLGNIEASAIVVSGEVEAGIMSAERIELRPEARVRATLVARVVSIADGAFYEGDVQLQPDTAESRSSLVDDRRPRPDEDPSRG